jgi:hypothetical protein
VFQGVLHAKHGILTWCPCIGHLALPSIQQHSSPEVCDLSGAICCEKNVLRLNIPVDNTFSVEISQPCYYISEIGP